MARELRVDAVRLGLESNMKIINKWAMLLTIGLAVSLMGNGALLMHAVLSAQRVAHQTEIAVLYKALSQSLIQEKDTMTPLEREAKENSIQMGQSICRLAGFSLYAQCMSVAHNMRSVVQETNAADDSSMERRHAIAKALAANDPAEAMRQFESDQWLDKTTLAQLKLLGVRR